jgi:hypothetical protein
VCACPESDSDPDGEDVALARAEQALRGKKVRENLKPWGRDIGPSTGPPPRLEAEVIMRRRSVESPKRLARSRRSYDHDGWI